MENLETFVDQLLDEKQLQVDEEVRAELKADMMARLLDQIDKAAVNELSEEQAIELANKLDDPNFTDEEFSKFIANSGVDLERVALETMLQFRLLYLGDDANVDTDAMREQAPATAE